MAQNENDMAGVTQEITSVWVTIDITRRGSNDGVTGEFPLSLRLTDAQEDALVAGLAPFYRGHPGFDGTEYMVHLTGDAIDSTEVWERERNESARLLDSIPGLLDEFGDDEDAD